MLRPAEAARALTLAALRQPSPLLRTARLAALAALALGLGACGRPAPPVPGRAIVVGVDSNPTSLDPRLSQDAVSWQIHRLLFRQLLAYGERGEIALDAAATWESSDLAHRFVLKEGLRFHDGSPLTSADVKYTFESIREPAMGSPRAAGLRELGAIETPSPREVVFRLKRPSASFPESLMVGIVPRSAAGAGKRFGERPVGAGPFRFVRFDPDERLELAAFEGQAAPPAYERLVFRIIPEETIRVLELESGGLHLLQDSFSPDFLPRLRAHPRLRIQRRPGTNFTYLGFNLADPILARPKVRRAIALAIDRRPIIRHILKGLAREADSLLPRGHWAHALGLPPIPHDPAQAMRLLDEAGLPDPDGPGPRPRFTLVFKTSQSELRRRTASVIADQLAKAGIEVKVRSHEWGTFFGDIRSGNFQLYSLTWVGISDPDIYRFVFHSGQAPPAGLNRGRYANPRVDELVEAAQRLPGRDQRAPLYHEVQRILGAELPYVNLWHTENVAALDRRIEGFVVYPNEDLISLAGARLAAEGGR